MTRTLYQTRILNLLAIPKHALPHHLFRGARRPKWSCLIGVSKTQKINLLGQGQPKHLNIQPHGQCYALKRSVSDLYVGSVYRMRSLAVSHSLVV